MAYRFAKERKVWWPIKVQMVMEDGTLSQEDVKILYQLIDGDELKAAIKDGDSKDGAITRLTKFLSKPSDDVDFLKKHVLGWKGVMAEDGSEIAFTETNLLMVMNDLLFAKAVSAGLYEASYGAARKN